MIKKVQAKYAAILKLFGLLTGKVFILMFLFFSLFAIFLFLAQNIFVGDTLSFDASVFLFSESLAGSSQTNMMQFFSFLGSHQFLIPANMALIIWFIFIKKVRWASVKIVAVSVSSLLLMLLLKSIFQRPRPLNPLLTEAAGFSFPSGHSLMSASFYGLVLYILFEQIKYKWWRFFLTIIIVSLVLMIGFSRIYLRVHYASDVIAGFCAGITWLILSLWILSKIEKKRGGINKEVILTQHNKI